MSSFYIPIKSRTNRFAWIHAAARRFASIPSRILQVLVLFLLLSANFYKIAPQADAFNADPLSPETLVQTQDQTEESSWAEDNSTRPFPQAESCPVGGDLILAESETCSLGAGTYLYNTITIKSGAILLGFAETSACRPHPVVSACP